MNTTIDEVRKHLINVDRYHAMAEAGLFPELPKVELINGEIFDMPPIGPAHGSVVIQITKRFVLAVADAAIVSVQNSIQLGDLSAPQPDVCLLRNKDDNYASALPQAEDVLLLVEVAQTSLNYDKETKARLYAVHGIVEYWVMDLPNRQLHVFKQPKNEIYGQTLILNSPEILRPDALTEVELDMTGLL